MNIRKAILSDLPTVVALNRSVHAMHAETFPERFRQDPPDNGVAHAFEEAMQSPSAHWLVAEDGQVVAFLTSEFRERGETWCAVAHRACYIGGVVVRADCRRKGIARMLLAELQREASSRGVTQIELDVWAFNDDARQAFLGLGFQSVMERMKLSAGLVPPGAAAHGSAVAADGIVSPPGENSMNEGRNTVIEADLSFPEHQAVIVRLLDAYATDPMGDGRPLSETAKRDLIPGLRQHPTTVVFLAYHDAEPVGLAICFRGFSTFAARPLINISDYFVFPEHRGKGIGRCLLGAIEQHARDCGCCRLTLEVQENNHQARRVYTAAGFSQSTHVPEAGGALYLSKSLASGESK